MKKIYNFLGERRLVFKSAELISLQSGAVGPVSLLKDASEFLTVCAYLRASAAHKYYIMLVVSILRYLKPSAI